LNEWGGAHVQHSNNRIEAREQAVIALVALLVAQAAAARVLTLQEAERVAQERQPQIKAARASTEAAEARIVQTRSGLLPQVAATAGYERTTFNRIFRTGAQAVFGGPGPTLDTINFYNSSVNVSQLIWDFGLTSDRWRASQASARATADQERTTWQQILFQVRGAFFNARAFKALLAVAQDTLANQRRHLVQIQGFVHAGTRPPIDLSQARATTANAEVQVINSANSYSTSRALLNQVMGVEGPTDYDVSNDALPPVPGEDGTFDGLLESALAARPEIAAAVEQVRAQQLTMQSARGGYGPAIGAFGTFTQGAISNDTNNRWDLAAGVTLTWQIFQGGLTKGLVSEAEAGLAFFVAQLDLVRQQVRVDVEQAWLAVRAGKAALAAARDSLVSARDRLSLAEGRYRNGAGSVIELGDAQNFETTAAALVVQTDYQLATARAQLARALGRP
jgi:outer membrane protein